jgi:rRNA maturation protein Nop10
MGTIKYGKCPHCGKDITIEISEKIVRDRYEEGKRIEVKIQKPD